MGVLQYSFLWICKYVMYVNSVLLINSYFDRLKTDISDFYGK